MAVALHTEDRYRGWLRYRAKLLGNTSGDALEASGEAWIWRLFSPGRRDVCGSAALYPSAEAAEDAAMRLVDEADSLSPVLVGNAETGGYSWYLLNDAGPAALAHRHFSAPREREVAVQNAVQWLAAAELDDGAPLPRWFNPRRLPMLGIDAEARESTVLDATPTGADPASSDGTGPHGRAPLAGVRIATHEQTASTRLSA
ncbi:hypothetical protein ACFOYW_17735 [Gryllotalpicola reticulitermitis]|uniref:Uncharacterized protein n=1 Tax=Gryllotalpicola reticulitermitis TaxID=1184153 RepID=A0ABV8QDY6_9MICO